MTRATYFGPGPAAIPLSVLEQARASILELDETGLSILEHSHRGAAYGAIHDATLELAREVLEVPDTHEILLLQGGARAQFALAPMNLRPPGRSADYLLTGTWARQALEEAQRTGAARAAADVRDDDGAYRRIPDAAELETDPHAAYLHVTTNNTLFGTQLRALPSPPPGVPLVADGTSDFGSRVLDLRRVGLLYAAAQKNLGMAGLTVVIIRRDLADRAPESTPKIFRYRTALDARSLQNTLPTFAVHVLGLVLRWMRDEGGLAALAARNEAKAALLYEALDAAADYYELPAAVPARSTANVVFRLPDADATQRFLDEAEGHGMLGLKGHRSVGGLRASLYNAVPPEAVATLAELVTDFARRHG